MAVAATPGGRYKIRLRDFPVFSFPNIAIVESSVLQFSRLREGKLRPGEDFRLVIAEGVLAEHGARLQRFAGKITVSAGPESDAATLLELTRRFRNLRLTFLFSGAEPAARTLATMAASLGHRVALDFPDAYPENRDAMTHVLGYFLRSPSLEAPIEPYFSVAKAFADNQTFDLWSYQGERPGVDYFIAPDGRVSLSERWAKRGFFFGDAAALDGLEDVATLHATELWQEVGAVEKQLLAGSAPCAFCPYFNYCGGYWVTSGNFEGDCASWKQLMGVLFDAYRQVKAPGGR